MALGGAANGIVRQLPWAQMIHARLFRARKDSRKLVASIRKTARETALAQGCDFLLSDGPPGIGCPVIASLSELSILPFWSLNRAFPACMTCSEPQSWFGDLKLISSRHQ